MRIHSGDCFSVVLDGKQTEVVTICSQDFGYSWIYSRADAPPSETSLLLTAKELQDSLGRTCDA